MVDFKKILFVADQNLPDKNTLLKVVDFTRAHNADLTVVLPIGTPITDRPFGWTNVIFEHWERLYSKEQNQWLRSYVADINKKSIKMEPRVLAGTPHLEIIKLDLSGGYGLVAKQGGSASSIRDRSYDALDRQLIRKCPCPVWINLPHRFRKVKRILAAIDPSPEDDISNRLNSKIINTATHLANPWNGELHVVHSWKIRGESMLRAGILPAAGTHHIDAILKETKKHHIDLVESLLRGRQLISIEPNIHVVKGEAHEEVSALAKKLRIELLVMGTLGRTGIAGKIIGNTAERILERADFSIMALKPPGYVSPVGV